MRKMKIKERNERAQGVLSHFLDNMGYWREVEYLVKGLSEEELEQVDLCGSRQWIEDHHIFFGTGSRTKSEEYGMKVHLCAECHREGPEAVHRYREADLYLKRTAQRQFEKEHTRQQFREIFGKSYLE